MPLRQLLPSLILVLATGCLTLGCSSGSGGGGGAAVTPPASGDTDPTLGSRFWYASETFGQPLKTHTGAENVDANDVLTLLNQHRAAQMPPLPPLTLDAEATRAAKAHAEDMQGRDYFDHDTPLPEQWDPGNRLQLLAASGYSGWGENIARGQATPAAAHAAWVGSPPHNANMLSTTWTHVGIGVEHDAGPSGPSGPYWVQVFLRRP